MQLGPFYASESLTRTTGVVSGTQAAYRKLNGNLTYSYVTLVYDDGRKVLMTSGGLVLSEHNLHIFADRALYLCDVPAFLDTESSEKQHPINPLHGGFLFGRKAVDRRFA